MVYMDIFGRGSTKFTVIYGVYMYASSGREITKFTVRDGVYICIRFWPTLLVKEKQHIGAVNLPVSGVLDAASRALKPLDGSNFKHSDYTFDACSVIRRTLSPGTPFMIYDASSIIRRTLSSVPFMMHAVS